MSIISDIEALRFLREPDYSKRVAKIVNNCRDLNDELIQLRQQVAKLKKQSKHRYFKPQFALFLKEFKF